jgi:hypothetical protein
MLAKQLKPMGLLREEVRCVKIPIDSDASADIGSSELKLKVCTLVGKGETFVDISL